MAKCQVPECFNRRDKDKGKKSFFRIPDPLKGYRDLAQRWLTNIGSDRQVDGFVFSKNKLVCEDHFEATCFREDLQARVLGYRPARKKLKLGSVPTIFASCQDGRRDPRQLWPSQHPTLGRIKNSKVRSRLKPDQSALVSGEVRSLSSSVGSAGEMVLCGPAEPSPSQQTSNFVQGKTVKTDQDDVTRWPSTRQTLSPVVSAAMSQSDTLNLTTGNHLKVRLVEIADKEVQTDPVLILPIRRYNCSQRNRVS